jgi:hypothetical protein
MNNGDAVHLCESDNELDEQIKSILIKMLQSESFYQEGVRPSNIIVIKDNKCVYKIGDFFSDEKIQEIIKDILQGYSLKDDTVK